MRKIKLKKPRNGSLIEERKIEDIIEPRKIGWDNRNNKQSDG